MKTRWLMVVPIVIIFAAGVNIHRHYRDEQRAKETAARTAALKDNLASMRKAIENFRADHARYPRSLQELVPNYIRRIPADPLTGAADWRVITEERVEASSDFTTPSPGPSLRSGPPSPASGRGESSLIIDVRSSAPGKDASGRLYSDY